MALPSLCLVSCCGLMQKASDGVVRPVFQVVETKAVFRVHGLSDDRKIVALTIDDAPSPETGKILDLLAERKATATFFIHGDRIRTAADRENIRRMLREGHEVGNHMPEAFPTYKLPPPVFRRQFARNHEILTALGAKPVRFRPSHGFGNKDMRRFIVHEAPEQGYRPHFYLASNYCWDIGKHGISPACYGRFTAASAVPGRITVFHDNQDLPDGKGGFINQSQRTLQGLPVYLDSLQAQGFSARSLAEVESLASTKTANP